MKKGCEVREGLWREVRERERGGGRGRKREGGKSSDTEWGALRCGERIIQNPEYEWQ